MVTFRPGQRVAMLSGGSINVIQGRATLHVGGDWWEIAGKTCVAAYQPKGAASLAASYINLANPGTYDAAPGTAPNWDVTSGWSGSYKYLTTGIVPASGWTVLIRFAGTANDGALFGIEGTNRWNIFPSFSGTAYFRAGGEATTTGVSSGVIGMAGQQGYHNGSTYGGAIGTGSIGTSALYLMALNNGGAQNHSIGWTFQAVVIYANTLTAGEVATVSTAMSGL